MNGGSLDTLISTYRTRGLLIDANLWLLLLVGRYDARLIERFKRTRRYTVDDFDLMQQFVALFERLVTTPHILTEVSNLSSQLRDEHRSEYFEGMALTVGAMEERHIPAATVVGAPHFLRFGLTDAAVVEIARGTCLVLTDDFPLANLLSSRGIDVLNFNHLRTMRWGLS